MLHTWWNTFRPRLRNSSQALCECLQVNSMSLFSFHTALKPSSLLFRFPPFWCSDAIWSVVLYELLNEAAAEKGDLSPWDVTKSAWCLHSRWACRRRFYILLQRKWGLLIRRCSKHTCCKWQRRAEVEICIQAQHCTPHCTEPGRGQANLQSIF